MRVVVFRLFRLAVWESLDGGGWLLKDCKTRISNLDQVAEGFRMLICRCLGTGIPLWGSSSVAFHLY